MPEPLPLTEDLKLVAEYRATGDLKVLARLFQRYTGMVYGVCLKYLKDKENSKDAVMQIYERLITLLHQHEVQHFKSWLYTVTRNHCLMELRAKKGQHLEDISEVHMESTYSWHPDEETDTEENLSKLEECIQTLNSEQRQCIECFYLEKLSYREVESRTGFTGLQVKSFIQNGKRNLKQCMERE